VSHRLRRTLFGAGTGAWERRVLRASERVYVCSADEEAALRAAGVEGVAVVPNGVDLESIRPTAEPADGVTVLFAGDLSYGPNVDAARWIAAEIAPAIRRRVDCCRIVVAGRSASTGLRAELSAAGVEVWSPVADMKDALAEASVVLVPLRSGGGTRLKVLEAFGAGRAVVSTTLGAEGIAAEHGRHLLIADSPTELVDATVGLLGDPGTRDRLAAEARRLVEDRYGWRAIGAALADDVERLLARGQHT
jgi:glycosyltransferase involved in cell wall biosynthesis